MVEETAGGNSLIEILGMWRSTDDDDNPGTSLLELLRLTRRGVKRKLGSTSLDDKYVAHALACLVPQ